MDEDTKPFLKKKTIPLNDAEYDECSNSEPKRKQVYYYRFYILHVVLILLYTFISILIMRLYTSQSPRLSCKY